MRHPEDQSADPEITATLEAIEATLAGEPVDPGYAEVAEVALLLAAERPTLSPEFGHELDRRVEGRFGGASRGATRVPKPTPPKRSRWNAWWALAPAAAAAVAGLVALFVLTAGQPGVSSGPSSAIVSGASARRPSSGAASAHEALTHSLRARRSASAPSTATASHGAPSTATSSPGLRPPTTGRKLIQSSQLSLGAPPTRIDAVAQEVFNVLGAQNGFVDSSTVTATGGTGGYARFQLTVPSATLPQTMTALSQLRYATVLSRTDKVEDVTGQLQSARRHHRNARVRALEHGIAYSQISLTIQADAPSSAAKHRSHGGFTIGRAAHDALDVLTVVGGVMLIALAVLVPLALVAALAWQIWAALRHRQRERALDLA